MKRTALISLVAFFFALPATAQYPERPLTILAGYPAGGMVDIVARLLAEGMKPKFPKGIVVLNRTGAGGAVAAGEVANGVWFLLMAPKGTPASVVRYLHDAARTAMENPAFGAAMSLRGIDVDYRPGDQLRADLWREYKLHTDILRRIGLVKQ